MTTQLTLERKSGYEFLVRIEESAVPPFTAEEGPPLGEGQGPAPDALLGAAVGSCLGSSLLYCLSKSHIESGALQVAVDVEKARNDAGRIRVSGIRVRLRAAVPPEQRERFERCKTLFEQFCTVTESVRHGLPVEVSTEHT